MSTTPTENELADISLCPQKLFDIDNNKLVPDTDYGINVGEGKKLSWEEDKALDKLFVGVSRSVWERPSYRAFYSLLDNYEKQTGISETMTSEEFNETRRFINTIMTTPPMQYVKNYLNAKGLASEDESEFKTMLFNLWFQFYGRDGRNDSSGFEHVFLGESDEGETKGLHNWIQFFIEEAKGNIDYRGYIFPRRRGEKPDSKERLMQIQLDWQGERKPITTLFLGTSPEFEVALYTLFFLAGRQDNRFQLLDYDCNVKCYRIRGDKLGTAYIELLE